MHLRSTAALLTSLLALPIAAQAQAVPPADEVGAQPYKLTLGHYHADRSGDATDFNLRRTLGSGNAWLGLFESPSQDERQWRLGVDANIEAAGLRWMPAGQIASHRYAAASIGVETGQTWFAGAGFGRTNGRPNTNLNFDPNDSYSLSAGLRADGGVSYQAQWIRDNRDNPDQRHLHLVYRTPLAAHHRLTIDLLFKQGLVEETPIRRWGASLGYDWPAFFIRAAYDPHVNFSPESMWRLSAGMRL
jgi:hypothetical protein